MLTPGPPPVGYVDRMLGWLAPQWALRRARARTALAALQGPAAAPPAARRGDPWCPPTPPAPRRWLDPPDA